MVQHLQAVLQPFDKHLNQDQSLRQHMRATCPAGLLGQPCERELDARRRTPARIRQL